LIGDKVLFFFTPCAVDETQPVALRRIFSISDMGCFSTVNDLEEKVLISGFVEQSQSLSHTFSKNIM
jgi:hypothetical protein